MATFNEQIFERENLPSIFELLAQESMSEALRPAIQHVTKVLSSILHIDSLVSSYIDEIWLIIEGTLQGIFIWKYDGSVSENFYDLVRYHKTWGIKWKSLIIMILVPYIIMKLDRIYNYLMEENDFSPLEISSHSCTTRQKIKYYLFKWIPLLLRAWKVLKFSFQLLYLCDKTNYYSPELWTAGVQLVRKVEPITNESPISNSNLSILSKLMLQYIAPLSLFLLKFIEWWYSSEREATVRKISSLPIPPPPPPQKDNNISVHSSLCPLCHKTRRNPTTLSCSGFVFCYVCIFNYVRRNGVCPMTSLPANENNLIRIFITT